MATFGNLKEQLMRELDKLPSDKLVEVLDFVSFLRTRKVIPSLPASSLDRLTGLVAWGGGCVGRYREAL